MTNPTAVSPAVRNAAITRLRNRLAAANPNTSIAVSVSALRHLIAALDEAKNHSDQAINDLRDEREHRAGAPCPHDTEAPAWDALERLVARLHRDLPGDGEIPPPADPYWAATLDALLKHADELYRPLAATPAATCGYVPTQRGRDLVDERRRHDTGGSDAAGR